MDSSCELHYGEFPNRSAQPYSLTLGLIFVHLISPGKRLIIVAKFYRHVLELSLYVQRLYRFLRFHMPIGPSQGFISASIANDAFLLHGAPILAYD